MTARSSSPDIFVGPPCHGRAFIFIATFKPRKYDQGNFVQACKALLDSLQPDKLSPELAVIQNDSTHWLVDCYQQHLSGDGPVGTFVYVSSIEGEVELESSILDSFSIK